MGSLVHLIAPVREAHASFTRSRVAADEFNTSYCYAIPSSIVYRTSSHGRSAMLWQSHVSFRRVVPTGSHPICTLEHFLSP